MKGIKLTPRYLVDEGGERNAVVLSMAEYEALLEKLEELEDALALDEAVDSSSSFRSLDEVTAELKKSGRI
jgi:hypothetical protein